jgi:hypothetical protein
VAEINSIKNSALKKVTGLTQKQIAGIRVEHPMALGGEDQVSYDRRVVIQKDRLALNHDVETSFEIVVRYIAKAIAQNREEVENALIVTGSPVAIRQLNTSQINALVQNRLTQNDLNGEAFRQYITALLVGMFGREMNKDKFFRVGESFAKADGDEHDEYSTETDNVIALQTKPATLLNTGVQAGTILPYQKTDNGGVEENKDPKDWGSILQGSAQVVTALGGVIGLFTGGQQSNPNDNAFNDYNTGNGNNGGNNGGKSSGSKWIIWLVVVAVVAGVGFLIYKQTKKKN